MKTRTLIAFSSFVVIALIGGLIFVIASQVGDASAHEYRIDIPLGTGELIAAGQDPQLIPAEIKLKVGDVLVIHNNDITGHQISDFWVGAGETLRQEFHTPTTYIGKCTVHKDSQIQIIVQGQ